MTWDDIKVDDPSNLTNGYLFAVDWNGMIVYLKAIVSSKGQASGIATLDENALIPATQLPNLSSTYSLVTHDHNGVYIPVTDAASFATIEHLHTGIYISQAEASSQFATIDHLHDGVYISQAEASNQFATIDHLHDDIYIPVSDTDNFATIDHLHTGTYLGINDKATDSDKLDGYDFTAFATANHLHTSIYEPSNENIQSHISSVSNPHGVTYSQTGAASSNHNHTGTYEPASAAIQIHINSTENPHGVNYTQVGAEPANANIQSHISSTSNPHDVTYSQIGALGASEKAVDSDKLDGLDSTEFATFAHVHTHSVLTDLQGGTNDEYYHLTASEHTDLVAIASTPDIVGYLKKTASDTWIIDTDTFATVEALASYQPLNSELTDLATFGDAVGLIKRNAYGIMGNTLYG